jgi:hypothetical protein
LVVANALGSNGNVSPESWEKVDGFRGSFSKRYGTRWAYLDKPWQRLAANLEYWIMTTDVCLRVGVEGDSVVSELGPNPFTFSVFALVAIQLLLAITRAEGLAVCSDCGAPFISKRQPLAGKRVGRWMARRNYCRNYQGKSVPQRDAARDYRKRKAQKAATLGVVPSLFSNPLPHLLWLASSGSRLLFASLPSFSAPAGRTRRNDINHSCPECFESEIDAKRCKRRGIRITAATAGLERICSQ